MMQTLANRSETTMPKKLDRSRGYGEIMGHEGGAAFEQDGVLFDAEGVELFNDNVPAKLAAQPKAAKAAAQPKAAKQAAQPKVAAPEPVQAPASADDQLAQQLEGGEGGLES